MGLHNHTPRECTAFPWGKTDASNQESTVGAVSFTIDYNLFYRFIARAFYAAAMRLLLAGGHRLPQADAAHQHGAMDMSGLTALFFGMATGVQIPVFLMIYSCSILPLVSCALTLGQDVAKSAQELYQVAT